MDTASSAPVVDCEERAALLAERLSVVEEELRQRTLDYQGSLETICSLLEDRQQILDSRREVFARLVGAEERERRRIAQDIHDDPLQMLVVAQMRLEMARDQMVGSRPPADLVHPIDEAQGMVRAALVRLRTLVFDVGLGELERAGLADALRLELNRLTDQGGFATFLSAQIDEPIPSEVQVLAFRIAREALNNVLKHASARNVRVVLSTREHELRLVVRDDGEGFLPVRAFPRPGHIGMTSMRERAESAGGWFRVHSEPGAGTEVEACIPLMASAVAAVV